MEAFVSRQASRPTDAPTPLNLSRRWNITTNCNLTSDVNGQDPRKCCRRLDTEIRTGFLKFEGVVELSFDKNEVKKRGNFKKSGQELQNQRKSVSTLLQYF